MFSDIYFNFELFESIWKNLSIVVILFDNDFKLVYVNDSVSELLGLGLKCIIN